MKTMSLFCLISLFLVSMVHAAGPEIVQYRYEAIKSIIKKYERPWTFLELVSETGDLSFKVAAQHHRVVCILAQSGNTNAQARCKNEALPNLVGVHKQLDLETLQNLSDCEHIDFTFISDITQIYSNNWQKALDSLLNMGDFVVVEAPVNNSSVERYYQQKGGKILANPPSQLKSVVGPLYLFAPHKKYLLKRYWLYKKEIRVGEYTLKSNFKEKRLIKEKLKPKEHVESDWIPGINLFTFKKLLGYWPERDMIIEMVLPMASMDHNDFRISNLIIQGLKLAPIDTDGKGHANTAADFLPHLIEQLSR